MPQLIPRTEIENKTETTNSTATAKKDPTAVKKDDNNKRNIIKIERSLFSRFFSSKGGVMWIGYLKQTDVTFSNNEFEYNEA